MKELLKQIDKAFDNKIRLAIMAILVRKKSATFNELKKILGATDGNLSSNATILEESLFIEVKKQFIKKKSNTSYHITEKGKLHFKSHIDALQKIIEAKNLEK
ncbi:MAG: transcriptional regulator [Thermonemataceae bacterium]|nr:transcriptional regulator [Thermonemataceae bacterium]